MGDDQAGTRAGAAYVYAQVPEPGALLWGVVGALMLMVKRRR